MARGVLDLLEEIDRAMDAGVYFLGLLGVLAVPDMCAALGAQNGRTDATKYRAWVRDNLSDDERQGLTPADIYRFRCSMLHEGSAFHGASSARIMFIEPGVGVELHNVRFENMGPDHESAHAVDLPSFARAVTAAARTWLEANLERRIVQANLVKFIARHPAGIPPFVVGTPVIG